jgi:hypothetical protein
MGEIVNTVDFLARNFFAIFFAASSDSFEPTLLTTATF